MIMMMTMSEPPTSNTLNQYKISVFFMAFQYFSENLAYYAPIVLILKPKLQYLSVFLQYFASSLPLKSVQVLKNQWLCTVPVHPVHLVTAENFISCV